jgi:hypothetical protein
MCFTFLKFIALLRPNYAMFYVGKSFTLRSVLEDIRDNEVGFHGGKDIH